ncbi:BamA/TamA family outer membrane protein [Vibrio navarrensis]|uniref:BamA/TamA family outer membrane protein n=1 Tax=Vibrio navarrensis TaxID=29495 RepID=UPI001E61152E|nr:BamA/TamA family outer membrane protein [Vibrio navarrensis]
MMTTLKRNSLLLLPLVLPISNVSWADGWPSWLPNTSAAPFYYTSEGMGNALGVAGAVKHLGQSNAALFGAVAYSDRGSYFTYLAASNYQFGDYWLLGAELYQGKYVDNEYYFRRAGDNDSSRDDRAIATGEESNNRLSIRYIVPWGHAAFRGARAAFEPSRQIKGHSPARSGITSLDFQPFQTSRSVQNMPSRDSDSTGLKVQLDWDNRNDVRDPSDGYRTNVAVSYADENWGNDNRWLKYEYQANAFWDLGSWEETFEKQVLAVDFYFADTPTWFECNERFVCERPPELDQVSLGGLQRLRSFPAGRFHGRSAIHYSAEYRVLPNWQPLSEVSLLNSYSIPWWQWVAFVDLGRVSDELDLFELHNSLKWSAGGGVRMQLEGLVVRAEMAWGGEGSQLRLMVNQPF